MKFHIMQQTESLHSIVIDLHSTPLDNRSLIYALTESNDGSRIFYSITAALSPCTDPRTDICIVHDITGERETAAGLFRLLAKEAVTPCTLEDILSDLL